ncbi:MAG: hypothetical protein RRZ42_03535 [Oscillospiraceae bacterium]
MISKGLFKAVRVLTAVLLTVIFVLVISKSGAITIVSSLAVLCLLALLCFAVSKADDRALTVIFAILLCGFGLALYKVGILLRVYPSWDFGRIYAGVADIIQNGFLKNTYEYFLESSNNLFPTLWITGFVRIASNFGQVYLHDTAILLNVISITTSVLFLFIAVKISLGAKTAFVSAAICFGFAPLYAYSPIVYTDTLSLPLMTLCLLLTVLGMKQCHSTVLSLLFGAFSGICAFIGYELKPTAAFPLIAAIVVCLLVQRKSFKFIVSACIFFALGLAIYSVWLRNTAMIDMSHIEEYRLPAMHYVRMGLIGNGGYSGEAHMACAALPNAAARTAQAKEQIGSILGDYGVGGLLLHLRDKLLYTWNDGLLYSGSVISQEPLAISSIHNIVLTDGKFYSIYNGYAQGVHLVMLGMLCAGSIKLAAMKKTYDNPIIPIAFIVILGVAVFLIVWETRSRYLVNCMPIFALCEAWLAVSIFGIRKKTSYRVRMNADSEKEQAVPLFQ